MILNRQFTSLLAKFDIKYYKTFDKISVPSNFILVTTIPSACEQKAY